MLSKGPWEWVYKEGGGDSFGRGKASRLLTSTQQLYDCEVLTINHVCKWGRNTNSTDLGEDLVYVCQSAHYYIKQGILLEEMAQGKGTEAGRRKTYLNTGCKAS